MLEGGKCLEEIPTRKGDWQCTGIHGNASLGLRGMSEERVHGRLCREGVTLVKSHKNWGNELWW